MNIQRVSLNSANVRYDNANEESRVYDIEANANINGKTVSGFDGGVVMKDGVQMATFSKWGTNLNPNFHNLEATEMCEVLMAINDFIESVTENVSNKTIEL